MLKFRFREKLLAIRRPIKVIRRGSVSPPNRNCEENSGAMKDFFFFFLYFFFLVILFSSFFFGKKLRLKIIVSKVVKVYDGKPLLSFRH